MLSFFTDSHTRLTTSIPKRCLRIVSIEGRASPSVKLPNLLLAPEFKQSILDRQEAWREVLVLANKLGIPVPAFSSSLDYFDSYRRANQLAHYLRSLGVETEVIVGLCVERSLDMS